jgi:hypothetical protein
MSKATFDNTGTDQEIPFDMKVLDKKEKKESINYGIVKINKLNYSFNNSIDSSLNLSLTQSGGGLLVDNLESLLKEY